MQCNLLFCFSKKVTKKEPRNPRLNERAGITARFRVGSLMWLLCYCGEEQRFPVESCFSFRFHNPCVYAVFATKFFLVFQLYVFSFLSRQKRKKKGDPKSKTASSVSCGHEPREGVPWCGFCTTVVKGSGSLVAMDSTSHSMIYCFIWFGCW